MKNPLKRATPPRINLTRCWCGNSKLSPYSPDYQLCLECHTLVTSRSIEPDLEHVRDEHRDMYGLKYFMDFARARAHPDLTERAHLDLSERCIYWIKALLAFRVPPARTLEIGCGSGAFVALLKSAGFDSKGLDLSPAVTEFARQTFSISVLTGPLEDQKLDAGIFDVVILMDVLEHLRKPIDMLRAATRCLADDGLILVQMPNFRPELSYDDLVRTEHAFLAQMQLEEHIYLYSRQSATKLMFELGFEHVAFLPAIFDLYDMFFAASRQPLEALGDGMWRESLRRTREGRVVEALIDNFDAARSRVTLQRHLDEVEVDRANRLNVILSQQQEIQALQQRAELAHQEQVERQHRLDQVEGDLSNRLAVILSQQRDIQSLQTTIDERGAELAQLRQRLDEVEIDRARRLEVILALRRDALKLQEDIDHERAEHAKTEMCLKDVEEDCVNHLSMILSQRQEIQAKQVAIDALAMKLQTQEEWLIAQKCELERVQTNYLRVLKRLGPLRYLFNVRTV